jgi:hypothetical protein
MKFVFWRTIRVFRVEAGVMADCEWRRSKS